MSYLFGKLCDQGISWHWKNDVRSWFKAARNFVFTPDSNRTLIWHCLICRDYVPCVLISFRAEVAVMAAQGARKHLLWWAGGWFTAVQRATFVMTSPAVSFRRTARRHYHTDALRKLHQPVQFPLPGRTCSAVAIIRQYVCCHPECDVLYQPHFWDSLAMQLFRFSSFLELVGKE